MPLRENQLNPKNFKERDSYECDCKEDDDCRPDEMDFCLLCSKISDGDYSTCYTRSEDGFFCEEKDKFYDVCCTKVATLVDTNWKDGEDNSDNYYELYWIYKCEVCNNMWRTRPD